MKQGRTTTWKSVGKVFGATLLVLVVALTAFVGFRLYTHRPPTPRPSNPSLLLGKKFPVTADDLAFGRKQVDKMMLDRPNMTQWVQKGDVIYNWVVRQFAGESIGHRVLWSPTFSPRKPPSANAYNNGRAIFVRNKYAAGPKKGEFIGSEELWAMAVFELFNLPGATKIRSLGKAAMIRKISRDDYIKQITQSEFPATEKASQFYYQIWQPWAIKNKATMQPHLWFVYAPDSPEGFFKQYTDPSNYPFADYGPVYDRLTQAQIVFTMRGQIYWRTPDGIYGSPLTYTPCYSGYGRRSPDRKKIVFESDRSGKKSIYLMDADGSHIVKLPAVKAKHPTFGLNGKTIVYTSNQSGNYEIYRMNADGTGQVQLTHTQIGYYSIFPTVSPDGQKIAFVYGKKVKNQQGRKKPQKDRFVSNIYVMNSDGTNVTQLTNQHSIDDLPCFSPDGQKIAFASTRSGNRDIYMMNTDGTGVVQLTNHPGNDSQPCFSPNGKKLAFASNRLDGKKYQLFKLDLATKQATLLFKTQYSAFLPDWN